MNFYNLKRGHLQMYVARYSGPTRLARLQLAAHRLASDEALDMLAQVLVWFLKVSSSFFRVPSLTNLPYVR